VVLPGYIYVRMCDVVGCGAIVVIYAYALDILGAFFLFREVSEGEVDGGLRG
jgi:hypothetical protein